MRFDQRPRRFERRYEQRQGFSSLPPLQRVNPSDSRKRKNARPDAVDGFRREDDDRSGRKVRGQPRESRRGKFVGLDSERADAMSGSAR